MRKTFTERSPFVLQMYCWVAVISFIYTTKDMEEPFKTKTAIETEYEAGGITSHPPVTSPFSRTSTLSRRGRMSFLLKRAKASLTSKDTNRDPTTRNQPPESDVQIPTPNEQLNSFIPPLDGADNRHSFYSQTTDSDSFHRSSDAQEPVMPPRRKRRGGFMPDILTHGDADDVEFEREDDQLSLISKNSTTRVSYNILQIF